MLSSMLKMDSNGLSDFLDKLCGLFQRMISGVLLINDINHTNVSKHFDTIATRIKENNPLAQIHKCYFDKNDGKCWHYGNNQQPNNKMAFQVPQNILNDFNPNTECHSAQLLLIKRNANQ